MKQPSNRRCYYYNKSSVSKKRPGLDFMRRTSALAGRKDMMIFSFHLRTIRLKWLQILESGNVRLGIKEFRQPCTKHNKIACALFSPAPEAVKWSQRPTDTIISGSSRSMIRRQHTLPPSHPHTRVRGRLCKKKGDWKSLRSRELTKTVNVPNSEVKSSLRDSE